MSRVTEAWHRVRTAPVVGYLGRQYVRTDESYSVKLTIPFHEAGDAEPNRCFRTIADGLDQRAHVSTGVRNVTQLQRQELPKCLPAERLLDRLNILCEVDR